MKALGLPRTECHFSPVATRIWPTISSRTISLTILTPLVHSLTLPSWLLLGHLHKTLFQDICTLFVLLFHHTHPSLTAQLFEFVQTAHQDEILHYHYLNYNLLSYKAPFSAPPCLLSSKILLCHNMVCLCLTRMYHRNRDSVSIM